MSHKRKLFASLRMFACWTLLASLLIHAPLAASQAPSAESSSPMVQQFMNPGTELWRDARQRGAPFSGETQVKGVDSGVLINADGDRWRQFRAYQLIPVAGYILGGVLIALGVFYAVRGRISVEEGRSGHKLLRYTVYERIVHWFMAGIFIFLALTGLLLLFGRPVLIPLIGKEAFSVLASASKEGHNLMGPLFLLALVLVVIRFVGRNIYQKGDLTWLLRGGGIIGKKHVPSNFFNMGEKTLFWLLFFVGGLIGLSGLVLVLPVFGQGREIMELAHVGHTIGAVLMIAVIFGHIYLGTIGMEGALEGMKSGYCDLNWAKEHHDLWAVQAQEQGEAVGNDEVARLVGDVRNMPPAATPVEEAGK